MNKICVIGYGISNAMEGDIRGGAEKQQALIFKGLKSRGFDIIVLQYYLEKSMRISGINFAPAWPSSSNTFYEKFKGLIREIEKHNVTAIYARTTQLYVALVYLFLKIKRSRIKLYWGIGADEDLTTKLNFSRVKSNSSFYDKMNSGLIFNICSRITFYVSDVIICQTFEQMEKCKKIMKNKSLELISSIYQDSFDHNIDSCSSEYDAVWVGKFAGNKGEDILLRLSKDLPELKILCLGRTLDHFKISNTYKEIQAQNNLFLKGRIPADKVPSYIAQANFVLNTSPAEGLSNVFLEGWNLGKPVISYVVNPNEYLTKGEAGYCAKESYIDLVENVKIIIKDNEFLKYSGEKGKRIVIENHNEELILSKYVNLFSK